MNKVFAALALVAFALAIGVMAIGAIGIAEMLAQELKNWLKKKGTK